MKTKSKEAKSNSGERLHKVTHQSISEILKKDKITRQDVPIDDTERKIFTDKINEHINSLKGSEREDYLDKVEAIIAPESDLKNQRWETVHINIVVCIGRLTQENHRLPTVSELARESSYSRKTIHAHLKDFESSPFFKEERQKFKILNHTVLARLFELAFQGDARACRLFLEFTGAVKSKGDIHNYIQLNSILITEDLISRLPQNLILEIENLIKNELSDESNKRLLS